MKVKHVRVHFEGANLPETFSCLLWLIHMVSLRRER